MFTSLISGCHFYRLFAHVLQYFFYRLRGLSKRIKQKQQETFPHSSRIQASEHFVSLLGQRFQASSSTVNISKKSLLDKVRAVVAGITFQLCIKRLGSTLMVLLHTMPGRRPRTTFEQTRRCWGGRATSRRTSPLCACPSCCSFWRWSSSKSLATLASSTSGNTSSFHLLHFYQ